MIAYFYNSIFRKVKIIYSLLCNIVTKRNNSQTLYEYYSIDIKINIR